MHLPGRPVLAGGALICAAALAGCASSGSSPPPAAGSSTTVTASPSAPGASSNTPAVVAPSSSPAAGSAACATSALRVKLGTSSGYAGGVNQTIDFTNTSGRPCTLTGYPGVSLVTGTSHQQLGLAAKRSTSSPATTVTLAPGATANAQLQIVDALNFPTPTCSPAKATDLKVFPPDQFTAVYLPDTSYGCGKSVQTLFIAPIRPGFSSQ